MITSQPPAAALTWAIALGPDFGAAENLAAGALGLAAAYAEILPHMDGRGPDWATGVADGLGNGLRYLAASWDHPDYRLYFAPQTPATPAAWAPAAATEAR
ncbi:hypothetical protein ABT160_45975 [Streptomyces sp. NPDC001941]|uniref:hypothetical protein n=1 Tax=Streptomyces sp. NPDC001941 TaxID=3154659 RepID=UPI00331DB087